MFNEKVLETLISSFRAGMSEDEVSALKGRILDLITTDNDEEIDDDSIDDRILRRLDSDDCPMSEGTRKQIRSSWEGSMTDGSDSAEDRMIEKRKAALLKLLYMKVHRFKEEDIARGRKAMNKTHVGLDGLKTFLLDEIASSVTNNRNPRPILLVGEPGCGKTSLAVSLASAFPERGHAVISLSGKDAAFELSGVDQSWRACTFGLILKAFLQAGSLSPVIIFDELDKIGTSNTHSRADSAFLDMLQNERAQVFVDAFMMVPVDISNGWFIFTANTLEGIPEPLLDRLTIFQMERYDFESMMGIAKRIIDEMNADALCPLRFSQVAMRTLVYGCYGMSTSVRPLRQAVEGIFASKAQLQLAKRKGEIRINETDVKKILSRDRLPSLVEDFLYSPGVVSGIGVADGRGYILPVEARNVHSPLHEVKVTGLVEQVMLESANIAYDLAASYAEKYLGKELEAVTVNYTYSFCKRGDSASLATALAILSDLTGVIIPKAVAITGAVSLKGNILPIGSVIAKITGVAEQGAEMVVLPEGNRKDVESVPSSMLPSIKLRYVSTFREAVESLLPPLKNCCKERLGA